MKRRAFIQAFAGAVATVAIGMKLSQGMPNLTEASFGLVPDQDIELRFKATERIIPWANDWRAVYGSPG